MSIKLKFKYSLYSLVLALVIGGFVISATGGNPLDTYMTVLVGSFGSVKAVMSVLAYATPLILTGLGCVVAFQGGVFNIGGEGQLCVGGLAAVIAGLYVQLPWPYGLIISLIAGFVAGAIWALIPTLMVGKNLASLFVGTVMMNSIGVSFSEYLVKYYFLKPQASTTETANVNAGAILPRFNPNTQLNYGIILAVILVFVVAWLLYKTPAGFSIRAIGVNPDASMQAGINVFNRTALTMIISGGICGLAGAVQCLGIYNRWIMGFSPGYGWDGITVATLAGINPFGVLLTGSFFGMLRSASISMNLSDKVPIDMITALQGLVVIFVASPTLWTTFRNLFGNLQAKIKPAGVTAVRGKGGKG
ncbi:MAG: ABC transporter permease [Bacillota bacterium]|nr:ABC transporter permease [Bacillota bacterium]